MKKLKISFRRRPIRGNCALCYFWFYLVFRFLISKQHFRWFLLKYFGKLTPNFSTKVRKMWFNFWYQNQSGWGMILWIMSGTFKHDIDSHSFCHIHFMTGMLFKNQLVTMHAFCSPILSTLNAMGWNVYALFNTRVYICIQWILQSTERIMKHFDILLITIRSYHTRSMDNIQRSQIGFHWCCDAGNHKFKLIILCDFCGINDSQFQCLWHQMTRLNTSYELRMHPISLNIWYWWVPSHNLCSFCSLIFNAINRWSAYANSIVPNTQFCNFQTWFMWIV